jgi:predicted transcriptional regulator
MPLIVFTLNKTSNLFDTIARLKKPGDYFLAHSILLNVAWLLNKIGSLTNCAEFRTSFHHAITEYFGK